MRPPIRWTPSLTAIGAAGIHPGSVPSDRQITDLPVKPLLQKYSDFQNKQITLEPPPSCPTKGRLEIVTDAGQDAVDASGARDEGA